MQFSKQFLRKSLIDLAEAKGKAPVDEKIAYVAGVGHSFKSRKIFIPPH